MRSANADYFNHDPDAPEYDEDVTREEHPIRTGYRATLDWVGSHAVAGQMVLDLGAGTGNTIMTLPVECAVTGVDVSSEMVRIARTKTVQYDVSFVQEDIMEYVDHADLRMFDVIVSTYALHHLTPDERRWLFLRCAEKMKPGVHIIVGDLMYENDRDRERIFRVYKESHPSLEEDVADEFFWNVEETMQTMANIGWTGRWERFSDLSWGVDFHVLEGGDGSLCER